MSDENEKIALLREILKWIKISGVKEVKTLLDLQIHTDPKRQIYHLSDGTKGSIEIAKIVGGLSHSTVARYWKGWEMVGLGDSISTSGGKRFKRSFNLEDFGIKVTIASQKQETGEQTISEVESNA